MNAMERGEFNNLMKDAFKDAEATPSENVWTNIELELEREDGGVIRRRLFYYKMVAAASVIFALSVGVASLYVLDSSSKFQNQQALLKESAGNSNTKNGKQATETQTPKDISNTVADDKTIIEENRNTSNNSELVQKNNEANNQNKNAANSASSSKSSLAINDVSANSKVNSLAGDSKSNNGLANNELAKGNTVLNDQNKTVVNSSISLTTGLAGADVLSKSKFNPVAENKVAQKSIVFENQQIYKTIEGNPFQSLSIQTASVYEFPRKLKPLNIEGEETEVKPDAGVLLLARLAQQELAIQEEEKKKENKSEKLWTSVGIAAGGFSAVNSSVSPAGLANASLNPANSTATQQTKASGSTYSVGINVGTKVAKRWVVQGGLNYMTQGSDYTANSVVASADFKNFGVASLNEIARDANSSQVVSTASYQVNNSLQYISVPLQAGYIIVNRKVSVQVNTGVSTDLFLQNTLTPESGDLDKTTQGSGSESPYRTLNFSGLVGTEISYKMGQHYRLALNPGVRYPFSSIYKSDVGVSASPLTFDVGLRFRYIFR